MTITTPVTGTKPNFIVVNRRRSAGNGNHGLAWKFGAARQVARFMLGRTVGDWIVVKNGHGKSPDRIVVFLLPVRYDVPVLCDEEVSAIEKDCKEA
jgi:hypothetical protein